MQAKFAYGAVNSGRAGADPGILEKTASPAMRLRGPHAPISPRMHPKRALSLEYISLGKLSSDHVTMTAYA